MEQAERIELVERARGGDRAAFAELVRAYQDLAAATAYGWLGDAETARDVAQEAFLEAHLHLDQLREPAAFGAWLRRIVIKHCDRASRRGSLLLTPLDLVSEPTSAESGPARATEDGEAAERLRLAVESLPAPERQVIALHYFAEATGPELAAFLELPLSTVKKRLRTARARLRTEGDRLMQETMNRLRPTLSGRLSREVSFFVALRAGDLDEVARMLAATPGLVDARQEWDAELVLEGVLPFANKATALITAVEQNNLDMLKLLLDAGADPDGACGCETMESPLWAATLLDREVHVRELLERGADPNRASAAGNYPLHLAAMRGREALVDLLLAHGADPNLLDAGARYVRPLTPLDDGERPGRTAAQWAAANGHQAIMQKLDPASAESQESVSAGRRMAIERVQGTILHTGIKAVDLFVPLRRGGLIRFPFKAGVGMVVLLGELCRRFCATPAGEAIWTGFAQPPFDLGDWEAEMAEFGLKDQVLASLASFNEAPEVRREAFERGVRLAESLRDAGRDVLAVVLSTGGFENDVDANLLRLAATGAPGSITTIVVTDFPECDNVWESLEPPYTGQITLDRRRATRYLFPAIDPTRSLSAELNAGSVGERHLALAQAARRLLADYVARDPELAGIEAADDERAMSGTSAVPKLLRYLCQPFFIAEPFTGRQGEWVGRDTLLDEIAGLVALRSHRGGAGDL